MRASRPPASVSSDLSPYIADSIRRRKLEREQRRALLEAAKLAGIRPLFGETLEQAVQRHRQWQRDSRRHSEASQRRRLRLREVEVETFTRAEIIERDRATCYLCLERVPPGEIHLDHVIPLSRGGAHTRANVRVACATCNIRKGALTEIEYRATLVAG